MTGRSLCDTLAATHGCACTGAQQAARHAFGHRLAGHALPSRHVAALALLGQVGSKTLLAALHSLG